MGWCWEDENVVEVAREAVFVSFADRTEGVCSWWRELVELGFKIGTEVEFMAFFGFRCGGVVLLNHWRVLRDAGHWSVLR